MTTPLYTPAILRLAAAAIDSRLAAPMASVEKRSRVCGSDVTVDVDLDAGGRVRALGLSVRACAFGQASAALLAAHAAGRSAGDLAAMRAQLAAWLTDETAALPDWPGIDALAPARPHSARHASILLPFEAAADAAARAAMRSAA